MDNKRGQTDAHGKDDDNGDKNAKDQVGDQTGKKEMQVRPSVPDEGNPLPKKVKSSGTSDTGPDLEMGLDLDLGLRPGGSGAKSGSQTNLGSGNLGSRSEIEEGGAYLFGVKIDESWPDRSGARSNAGVKKIVENESKKMTLVDLAAEKGWSTRGNSSDVVGGYEASLLGSVSGTGVEVVTNKGGESGRKRDRMQVRVPKKRNSDGIVVRSRSREVQGGFGSRGTSDMRGEGVSEINCNLRHRCKYCLKWFEIGEPKGIDGEVSENLGASGSIEVTVPMNKVGWGEFKCLNCDRTFSSSQGLGSHKLVCLAEGNEGQPIHCALCNKTFDNPQSHGGHVTACKKKHLQNQGGEAKEGGEDADGPA